MNDIPKKFKTEKNIKRGTVLITGGAKRLGSLVALNLARKGWNILLHYNQSEAEANLTKEKIIKCEHQEILFLIKFNGNTRT